MMLGVARHDDVFVAFALLLQFVEELFYGLDDLLEFVACVEFEVDEHLVVA